MPTYYVRKAGWILGKDRVVDETVTATEDQAKYLLLNGSIALTKSDGSVTPNPPRPTVVQTDVVPLERGGAAHPVQVSDIAKAVRDTIISPADLPISYCPLPPGLSWDMDAYPIERVGYREIGGGLRKGIVEGFTPFSGKQGTPYYQCRNGTQLFTDPVAGNDTTGTGTLANPFKTRDKAQTVANGLGQPATIFFNASAEISRLDGANWTVAPTVPTAYVARGGTVITGSFANYTWAADATYGWCFRAARTSVASVYDRSQFDRFGNYIPYIRVASLAACSRIPGSWFQDTSDVVVHPFDEVLPTPSTILVLVATAAGDAMDRTMGAAPQHIFFDGETDADSFEVRGQRIKIQASAYAADQRIFAARRLASKYVGYPNADTQNGIGWNNLNGLVWLEDIYVGRAGYDSVNGHNELLTKPSRVVTVNVRAQQSGMVSPASVGSQNHWALHANLVGIDVAGDYEYARGGTVKNGDTTQTFMHGSRLRADRGDNNIVSATTFPPTEAMFRQDAKAWLSEVILDPAAGGFALRQIENAQVLLRNMPAIRGRVSGNIGTW